MGLALREADLEAFRDGTPAPRARASAPKSDRRGPLRPSGLALSRLRLRRWTLGAVFRIADAGVLFVTALAAAALAPDAGGQLPLAPVLAAFAILIWALGALDAYRMGAGGSLGRQLIRLCAACGLGALVLGLALDAFGARDQIAPTAMMFCLSLAVLICLHLVWWAKVRAWRAVGRLTPNIVVVGATHNAGLLIRGLMASREAAVIGVFDDRMDRAPGHVAGVPVLGDVEALIGHRLTPYVDKIVITVSSMAKARVRSLIERLAELPNEIVLFVDHDGEAARAAAISRIADAPLAYVAGAPSNERRALTKRLQDLVVGGATLALALPVMTAIAVAIRLESPGPVLFRQRRHGFNNETFAVWKFRSMRVDATASEGQRAERQVREDDERITRVGRIIRRTSLDELPQIFNVLRGEMSLVGPRPHAVGMKTAGTESARLVAGYAHRHRIKPGMTGWAAIHGSRGPVDTSEAVRRRVALDIEYIERQSFWLDLFIMAMTIPCLLGDAEAVR
jgi:Undecaprenyl-phosphate glucose phosphotransferase